MREVRILLYARRYNIIMDKNHDGISVEQIVSGGNICMSPTIGLRCLQQSEEALDKAAISY